ncbi:acylphosphatase [Segetibacter sp. 3557_3]|uniref:acylphosphatase n=1 Tax=Segetibacter sp. 3557_3 TaxID=2547429 RepID=UPI001058860C|nr:acylphosphatase [Segetibacter sp. 3557_3]TDH26515.1 acylphosphatase [Segetibacter sp. 3557_3]
MSTYHLVVSGKVQGVFFRATAKEVAVEKGLIGWVRNTNDDEVEILATGSEEALQDFIKWCWKGPDRAMVRNVVITKVDDQHFDRFSIKRD